MLVSHYFHCNGRQELTRQEPFGVCNKRRERLNARQTFSIAPWFVAATQCRALPSTHGGERIDKRCDDSDQGEYMRGPSGGNAVVGTTALLLLWLWLIQCVGRVLAWAREWRADSHDEREVGL